MRDLEEIRSDIAKCDDEILMQLEHRMNCINEIITYKKINGVPILQAQQEEKQQARLRSLADGNPYEEEILNIFYSITEMSKHVQAKALIHGNIALIGFMGTGKTSVSRVLKDMLAMDNVGSDEVVVKMAGMSINDIFAKYGEEHFRNLETRALASFASLKQTVIDCGGGAVLRPKNIEILRTHSRIVLLTASPETILERLKNDDSRPVLRGKKTIAGITELMNKRADAYKAAADVIVNTDNKTIMQVCEEIITKPIAFNKRTEEQTTQD